MHYYHVDIYDWYRGTLSSRRLLNLIRRLPDDSQLSHDVNGESADWSRGDHLQAVAADLLNQLVWAYTSVHGDDKPKPPAPIPRPGMGDPSPGIPASSTADMTRFFMS